ncbi:putative RING-H2 finger protein ATL21A [Abrus precatorius]|uniref:RING-type E3 ubiquitin transferase n=1 Tax=Abrus precatorius TaxID=3816 RepID=A0A8B8KIP3_ABRPR|nr:putative RING-H2 finger protein ATL21A [Abrus precatorius]
MAPSTILYVFCILLFHLQITRGKQVNCNSLSCGDIDIQFPFGLKGSNQDRSCSYYPAPTFHLSCINRTQTILTLPYFGDLLVKSIDYESQSIRVNDPNGCLPKRFLHKWNLSGSPFKLNPALYGTTPYNLTFRRCPSNVTDSPQLPLVPISCLSNSNNSSVIVSWSQPIVSSPMVSQWCEVISWAYVPLPTLDIPMWPFWPDLNDDLQLVWAQPRCKECALSGQLCGFSKDNSLQVACYPSSRSSSKGLSRSAKYGLAIGVGIPGLLCIIGFSCFLCGKFRMMTHRGPSTELPATISLEPIPFVMGLDGATIEKYPKTLLGESGRLLKPNDNTCAICLSEYEPKETLRSIPECNHYFHAQCIDEWLKMNGTCPICRNSPEASSTISFSSLSPTSSLSSS